MQLNILFREKDNNFSNQFICSISEYSSQESAVLSSPRPFTDNTTQSENPSVNFHEPDGSGEPRNENGSNWNGKY